MAGRTEQAKVKGSQRRPREAPRQSFVSSLFRFLFGFGFQAFIAVSAILLSVNFWPKFIFKDFPIEPQTLPMRNFSSVKHLWNTDLTDSPSLEFIQLNQVLGPESIAVNKANGLLYSGLADGRVVEFDPKADYRVREVLKFANLPQCIPDIASRSEDCGRFLTMRFQNGSLYGLEAAHGLYMIDTQKGTKKLVGPIHPLNTVNLYNSFAFDPKDPDIVYLTVSSTKWNIAKIFWSLFDMDNSGQLMAFSRSSGKRVVLARNLYVPNGLDIDVSSDKLIFSESMKSQVSQIDLSTAREAFNSARNGARLDSVPVNTLIEVTPGNPDNIVIEGDHAYIAIPFAKPYGADFTDRLYEMPSARNSIAKIIYAAGYLLEYIHNNYYPNPMLEHYYFELKSGHILYHLTGTQSGLVVYNLRTQDMKFFGSDTFSFLSEGRPDNQGNILLGSFRSSFLVKTKIKL